MTRTTSCSGDAAAALIPLEAYLERAVAEQGCSPEVAAYCHSRGVPLPTTAPPALRTPEPRDVPGAVFLAEAVDRVVAVFRRLRHVKGRWAGRPLEPDPWQLFHLIAPVFGWHAPGEDDPDRLVRIVREAWWELPRKQGKTTLASGVSLYLLTADREPGAEVYAAAVDRDQARLVFDPAKKMAERSPAISRRVEVLRDVILAPATNSTYRVLSSDVPTKQGLNVHGLIGDEIHAHPDRGLLDVLLTGTGSREQPLAVLITTADDGKPGTIYDEKHTYVEQLARLVLVDPSTYGVIFAAPEDADPFDPATWERANPGLGTTISRGYLEREARKAKASPAYLAVFCRYHLNQRKRVTGRGLTLAAWDRSAGLVDELKLAGRRCWGGLDLASESDLASYALTFPDDADPRGYDVLFRAFAPEAVLTELDARTAGQASVWAREGLLTLTAGNVIDYAAIKAQLGRDAERYDIVDVGYDRWGATQLATELTEAGLELVRISQGFAGMGPPTREWLRLVLDTGEDEQPAPRYRHGGNPLVRWCVDSLALASDPAGNLKPDKRKSRDRIDPVVAAIMSLDRALRGAAEPPKRGRRAAGF